MSGNICGNESEPRQHDFRMRGQCHHLTIADGNSFSLNLSVCDLTFGALQMPPWILGDMNKVVFSWRGSIRLGLHGWSKEGDFSDTPNWGIGNGLNDSPSGLKVPISKAQ